MAANHGGIRKPRGLTDEEWIEILRAWGGSYWQYVFGSFHLIYANLMVALCTLPFWWANALANWAVRHVSYGQQPAVPTGSIFDTLDLRRLFPGMLAVSAVTVIVRTCDWFARRRVARAAGL